MRKDPDVRKEPLSDAEKATFDGDGRMTVSRSDDGWGANVSKAEVLNAIKQLRRMRPQKRRMIILSVNRSLDELEPRIKAGIGVTNEDVVDVAQDTILWYANEVIEGRRPHPDEPVQ
jgi:hypothetical protein